MNELVSKSGNADLPKPLSPVLTPASEQGVRLLFEGLAAVHETSEFGAPAGAAIAITPGLYSLLLQYCGKDRRFALVMANVHLVSHAAMKQHSSSNEMGVVVERQTKPRSWFRRLIG